MSGPAIQQKGFMAKFCISTMHIVSIVAYGIALITIAALEFGDANWSLYLHTVKTVSAAGVFNYSLSPSVIMHYNLSQLPEYVSLDGTTIGEPVGIFSPVLVACVALGISILGHIVYLIAGLLEGNFSISSNTLKSISVLHTNITKLILVILVFMVSGMRDVGSIMLICGIQIAVAFMYFTIMHLNDPEEFTNNNGGYTPLAGPSRKPSSTKQGPKPGDPEDAIETPDQIKGVNMVMRLTLLLVLVFQYVALGLVISGNYVQINMLYVTAVFLFVHDLFYYLTFAVILPGQLMCGDLGSCYGMRLNYAIFFDWLITVPIPFFLYFSLHNVASS